MSNNEISLKPSQFNVEFNYNDQIAVYNTFSGALGLMHSDLMEHYAKLLEEGNIEEIDSLVSQGFLVSKELHEDNMVVVKRNQEIWGSQNKCLFFDIAPTLKCQAKCDYCFEGSVNLKSRADDETVKKIINYIISQHKAYKSQMISLTFFGGEPLLEFDNLCYIGEQIKNYSIKNNVKFYSTILTNGILFDRERVLALVEKCNLTEAQISLDGMREDYYAVKHIDAFDRVISNISETHDLLRINVRLNVTKANLNRIDESIIYLLEKMQLDGKIKLYLARVQSSEGVVCNNNAFVEESEFMALKASVFRKYLPRFKSIQAQDLLPGVRRNFCGLEKSSSTLIGPDGCFYKCEKALGIPAETVGDVNNGRTYGLNEMAYYMPIDNKCSKCSLLPICFGGCPNVRKDVGIPTQCEGKHKQLITELTIYLDYKLNNL